MRFGSKQCACLALAFCAAAIYGSFVPFQFAACSWTDAASHLRSVCNFATRPSRSDFAANVLLFVPIGFFLTGTLALDRRPWVRWAALLVPPSALVLSGAIEFVQIYFPPRTPSLNDVIAQTIGTAAGVALWLTAGGRVVEYVRAVQTQRAAGAPVRLLPAYLLVLLLVHVMPLDLTISPVEVYHKYKEGRIVLLPFGGALLEGFTAKLIWNVAFFMPLGWLYAAKPIESSRGRGRVKPVLLVGLLVAVAVELAQLPVRSRSFDATDIVTGTVGVLLGSQLARAFARRSAASRQAALVSVVRSEVVRFACIAAWLVLLVGVHWRPFDFAAGLTVANARAAEINWIPFADYLVDSEYHAFDELHRKFLLFLPLGGLLAARPAASRRSSLAVVIAVAVVIEAGQILLPGRYPSLTDVLVQSLGGWAGVVLAAWRRSRNERAEQDRVVPLPAVS